MARGQVSKIPVQTNPLMDFETNQVVFALDIGTRSIIGMVGVVEEGKVRIVAIEREEHTERAMIDGQIENIEKVAALAERVKKRLENQLGLTLDRVCVAAAGRALRTRRADFEMELSGTQMIDDEIISRLEAGAINKAEEAFDAENEAVGDSRRFYLVGYTVCQYYLDQYTMSSLKDHRGRLVKVDLIATFLPSEVVESLYTTMNKIGLEVASLTLEPIAAINAAIPENLRLLNLVMVDIGAGTSDIAACTGGSVTGYTMATVAGDEVTETLMKAYLVDFETAEKIKSQMDQDKEIIFADILGFEHKVPQEEVFEKIQGTSELLCKEIGDKIVEVNGGPPSALFLAGGGSKLARLREGLAEALGMDLNRVAIAGNYFQASAFSEEYDLNNPEYATPLGIAISSGLNRINDSFRVILNDKPAKLFRSGSFTALNLLMMNGYSFRDIMGRSGMNLAVTVNGERKVFYGTAAKPASLLINGKEGKLSEIIHAGDSIDFEPAESGISAKACLGDLEGASSCEEITLNGTYAFLETPLKNGDVVIMKFPGNENNNGKDRLTDLMSQPQKQQETEKRAAFRETPVLETPAGGGKRKNRVEAEENLETNEYLTENSKTADGNLAEDSQKTDENLMGETWNEGENLTGVSQNTGENLVGETWNADKKLTEDNQKAAESSVKESGVTQARENGKSEENLTASGEKESMAALFKGRRRAAAALTRGRMADLSRKRSETVGRMSEREGITYDSSRQERKTEDIIKATNPTNGLPENGETAAALGANFKPSELAKPKTETKIEEKTQEEEKRKVEVQDDFEIQEELEMQEELEIQEEIEIHEETEILFYLNGSPLRLPAKEDGQPYYLMDLIEHSGIDLKNPKGAIRLTINGAAGLFQQELRERDAVEIREEERSF